MQQGKEASVTLSGTLTDLLFTDNWSLSYTLAL